jgi:hypothetical protein
MAFEGLSTFPFIIPEIATLPLDLPVRPPHAEAMMDPGEIPELVELIDAFQLDTSAEANYLGRVSQTPRQPRAFELL